MVDDRADREGTDLAPAAREARLIEKARSGDPASFEELVRTYQDVALRTAYVIVGDHDEAGDAAQEAFVKAFHALGRFRAGAPFRPWILRIVANEAINKRRAAHRRADLRIRVSLADPPRRLEAGPEETVLAAERRDELLAAVNALRPEDRLVIAYRYWLELPEAEMAAALGVARGTVKSRLSRALGRLRGRVTQSSGTRSSGEGSSDA